MNTGEVQPASNYLCQLGENSLQIGANQADPKFFKGSNGVNDKSMTLPQNGATQNCQSLDPFSLRNRLQSSNNLESKVKLNNDRRELDSLALSEFKLN